MARTKMMCTKAKLQLRPPLEMTPVDVPNSGEVSSYDGLPLYVRREPPPKTRALFKVPYQPTLMGKQEGRRKQINWVHRRVQDFKKTHQGYNTFTELEALEKLICNRERPSREDMVNALTSLRETILADLNLVDENARQKGRDEHRHQFSGRIDEIQATLEGLKGGAKHAEQKDKDALHELNMNFFKINDDPIEVDAQPYTELDELALECNFLKEEDLLSMLVSDNE